MLGAPMQKRLNKFITALTLFLLGYSGVAAAPPARVLTLKANAPARYVVVKGDTLWGIAGRYTNSPWRWPELWRLNETEIKNPNLIYPGDVIVLNRSTERLSLLRGGKRVSLLKSTRLEPRIRVEGSTQKPIATIPASAIAAFLSKPIVVEPGSLNKAPTIVATEEDHVVLGAGNTAYVEGFGKSNQKVWNIYRQGSVLVDPENGHTLGYEGVYLGTARIVRTGNPTTIKITSATQEIATGDKLLPLARPQPIDYAPHAPATFVKGRIISLYQGLNGVGEAGPDSIVAIDLGKANGMDPGTVLALYRPGHTIHGYKAESDAHGSIKVPDERYGVAMVFRVFDHVSYALVMRITRPVQPLDIVETP